jgi:hypothetical protein
VTNDDACAKIYLRMFGKCFYLIALIWFCCLDLDFDSVILDFISSFRGSR